MEIVQREYIIPGHCEPATRDKEEQGYQVIRNVPCIKESLDCLGARLRFLGVICIGYETLACGRTNPEAGSQLPDIEE